MKAKKNIVWHRQTITSSDREKRNKHKGAILWLTGLPASGKSTTAHALEEALFKSGVQCYSLDGDNVRHGLNNNLGFSKDDRKENIRRIGEVAKLFLDAGFVIITSFISPYREDRDNIRKLVQPGQFIEIFVDCSLQECEKRDPKGFYQKARKGEIKDFTGVSAPYEAPKNPEIHIKTHSESVKECVSKIVNYLVKNKIIPKG